MPERKLLIHPQLPFGSCQFSFALFFFALVFHVKKFCQLDFERYKIVCDLSIFSDFRLEKTQTDVTLITLCAGHFYCRNLRAASALANTCWYLVNNAKETRRFNWKVTSQTLDSSDHFSDTQRKLAYGLPTSIVVCACGWAMGTMFLPCRNSLFAATTFFLVTAHCYAKTNVDMRAVCYEIKLWRLWRKDKVIHQNPCLILYFQLFYFQSLLFNEKKYFFCKKK